jgi:uncharacterized protein
LPEFICNTSPLQYLHQLELLHILPALTGGVIVPESVADELGEGISKGWNVPNLQNLSWITIRRPISAPALPLASDLGNGEAGVLALALETKDAIVIIDDAVGRRAAELLEIKLTGTIGLLLDAKAKGLIASVRARLDELTRLRFRVSKTTYAAVLKLAGEI